MYLRYFIFLFIIHLQCQGTRKYRSSGDETFLSFENRTRSFIIYKPEKLKKNPSLLVCLHGGGGTASGMIRQTKERFNDLADEKGFLVVYPNAWHNHWNDGRNDQISDAHKQNINDVGFVSYLIEYMQDEFQIDKSRVFVTGISNGGFMSYRIACELHVRGIAAVAASLPKDLLPECDPEDPVDIMIINGTKDPLVPYEGGIVQALGKERGEVVSTNSTIEFWTQKNRCDSIFVRYDMPNTSLKDDTRSIRYLYQCNQNRVSLIKVVGGGHTWPDGNAFFGRRIVGNTAHDFNGCDVIWTFFEESN